MLVVTSRRVLKRVAAVPKISHPIHPHPRPAPNHVTQSMDDAQFDTFVKGMAK
jgi:hypothetical protein